MRKTARRAVGPMALLLLLTAGSAVAGETPYRGLESYRTAGGKYRYEPVVLVPDSTAKPVLAENLATYRLQVKSLAYITGSRVPRAEEVLKGDAPGTFEIERPAEPLALQERFDEQIAGLSTAPCILILGLRPQLPDRPYSPVLDRKGNGLGSPIFSPPPSDLQRWIDAAAEYARLGDVSTLDQAAWAEVGRVSVPEIRFVALIDVLYASYQRGLSDRPVSDRVTLVRDIRAAMGSELTIERWLRIHIGSDAWDRNEALLDETLSPASRLVEGAASRDPLIALRTLAVAGSQQASSRTAAMALEIVRAYVSREEAPSAAGLGAATTLASRAPAGEPADAGLARDLVSGLARAEAVIRDSHPRAGVWRLATVLAGKSQLVRSELGTSRDPRVTGFREALRHAKNTPKHAAVVDELDALLRPR